MRHAGYVPATTDALVLHQANRFILSTLAKKTGFTAAQTPMSIVEHFGNQSSASIPCALIASGLVIPDTAKEKPQEGKVIAVGPGRFDEDGEKRIPMDIKTGDTVVFSKYGGTEVSYDGKDYLLLSARDVLAIVSK
jgi:chaperonin GroES